MKLLYILCTLSIIFATNVCAQNSSNKDESVTMQDTVSKSVSQLSCKKRTGQVWPVLTSL